MRDKKKHWSLNKSLATTIAVLLLASGFTFTPPNARGDPIGIESSLTTFNNPTPPNFDQFDSSVSIYENNVLVGAPFDDIGGTDAGSAYLFDATTGGLLVTFNNPSPEPDDFFGQSVSISGFNVLVGAPNDNTGADNADSSCLRIHHTRSPAFSLTLTRASRK